MTCALNACVYVVDLGFISQTRMLERECCKNWILWFRMHESWATICGCVWVAFESLRRMRTCLSVFLSYHVHTCCIPILIIICVTLSHSPLVVRFMGAKDNGQMQNSCIFVIPLMLAEREINAARWTISDHSDMQMQRSWKLERLHALFSTIRGANAMKLWVTLKALTFLVGRGVDAHEVPSVQWPCEFESCI